MSPGESVLPRNVRACQVGPLLFWRPYKRRIGQQINSNSSQHVHLHSFALQCLCFFMKFGVFKKQHLLSRSTRKNKTEMYFSLCASQRAPTMFTPQLLLSNIDFKRNTYISLLCSPSDRLPLSTSWTQN